MNSRNYSKTIAAYARYNTNIEQRLQASFEHKWFEFGKDDKGNDIPKTVISREYSLEWKVGDEPYYPVNDEKNGKLYQEKS